MKQVTATPTNRSVERALMVAEALAASSEPLRLTDVAVAVGLDKATVRRLLATLRAIGYVEQHGDTGRYSLTPRVWKLTRGYQGPSDLRSIARPHLEALRDHADETVHLGVRDGLKVVYVDKLEADHSIRLVSAVGSAQWLHTTGLGKAILAFLPPEEAAAVIDRGDLPRRTAKSLTDAHLLHDDCHKARGRGYASDLQENEDHVICVGAPILVGGRPIASISVSGPDFRMADRVQELGALAAARASQIAAQAKSLLPERDLLRADS